jgi:hypothetical protein
MFKNENSKIWDSLIFASKKIDFSFFYPLFQGKNNPCKKYPSSEGIKKNSDHKSPKREHGT